MRHRITRGLTGLILVVTLAGTIVYCTNKDFSSSGMIFSSSVAGAREANIATNSVLAQIKARGELVALTRYNTSSYFIYKGQPMGYEYEMLKLLANYLDVDLKIVATDDWSGMFDALENGQGDIIAANLIVSESRATKLAFTDSYRITRQVLVQRKPDGWRKMTTHGLNASLIRDPVALIGRTVSVRQSSAYYTSLVELSRELGGNINIDPIPEDVETEELIKLVAEGKIDFTVADEDVARLNQAYFSNLDVETVLSLPQSIAWAVRKDAPHLLSEVNKWLNSLQSTYDPTFNVIYKKYYKNNQAFARHMTSAYSSKNGDKISEYDDLFRINASRIGWDWRLIAAQAFEESHFDIHTESRMGAVGMMQLLPTTGKDFGANNLRNPAENIRAGASYLKWLDEYWSKEILDPNERLKFVLASYNAGQGHIQDARRLATKYGYSSDLWDGNVALFLLKKSKKKYYNDPIVRFGYCRGIEPFNYVKGVLNRYEHYKKMLT
ncbi:MAG: lytic transglycosylase F [Candidatus Marinimicrobia bacterium CG_4_10_14_0_2_um_filter_48_9]|nr:MAG: lytic transglycosylase F [Candidatus Marinimicrobia bacterium CG_4_10_14_0_2_um_filter_48_9]